MNKFILLFITIFSLSYQNIFAVATPPSQALSVDPTSAEVGKAIKINALLYNNQKENINFVVNFTSGEKLLGTQNVLIAPSSAKTVSISSTQPKEKIEISVTIVSAVTKNKKEIVDLQGLVGKITLGQDSPKTTNILENKTTGMFSSIRLDLEKFRLKQASYFANLRDKTKSKLGMQIKEDVINKITPIFKAPVVTVPGSETPQKLGDLDNTKIDNPKEYGILIFATSMASLFASSIMFYSVLVFMVLYILRTFFKIFI